jgi:hypothetical protein
VTEHRRLAALPSRYADTRERLHLVAARVLAAARFTAVGRLGLEVAAGGFATPQFEGRRLAVSHGFLEDGERRVRLTTLGEAWEFAGVDPDAPLHPVLQLAGDATTDVSVDEAAAEALAQWFAVCQDALAAFAAGCAEDEDATSITLWPEHFDVALSAGTDARRANYGGSAGDAGICEPYLYVGPFELRRGEFWNSDFGAALTHDEVRAGVDPLTFLFEGRSLLAQDL